MTRHKSSDRKVLEASTKQIKNGKPTLTRQIEHKAFFLSPRTNGKLLGLMNTRGFVKNFFLKLSRFTLKSTKQFKYNRKAFFLR